MYMANLFVWFPWLWLIVVTIVAQVVGAIWYGPLFSKAYGKEWGFTEKDMKAGKESMAGLMIREVLSRLVFFLGLWLLLQYVGVDHRWTVGALYFLAALSTDRSSVIWSKGHTWRLRAMRSAKIAIDLVIALCLYVVL